MLLNDGHAKAHVAQQPPASRRVELHHLTEGVCGGGRD